MVNNKNNMYCIYMLVCLIDLRIIFFIICCDYIDKIKSNLKLYMDNNF